MCFKTFCRNWCNKKWRAPFSNLISGTNYLENDAKPYYCKMNVYSNSILKKRTVIIITLIIHLTISWLHLADIEFSVITIFTFYTQSTSSINRTETIQTTEIVNHTPSPLNVTITAATVVLCTLIVTLLVAYII